MFRPPKLVELLEIARPVRFSLQKGFLVSSASSKRHVDRTIGLAARWFLPVREEPRVAFSGVIANFNP